MTLGESKGGYFLVRCWGREGFLGRGSSLFNKQAENCAISLKYRLV